MTSNPAPISAMLANPAGAWTDESINLNEEASVDYWLSALACSELALRRAVAAVGPDAREVRTALGGSA